MGSAQAAGAQALTLEDLARAAEEHARQEHGRSIGLDAAREVDAILRAGKPGPLETLAACYGAWLGRLAVRRWNARWVGLSEPVPPRLLVAGVLVSPIDAVRRRLVDPAAPSIPEILERFEEWSRREAADRARASENRGAWDRLAEDPRFAGTPEVPDPEAALDEWLRDEGVRGKDLLCLGAGGGRHGPLHARAGARVTVVDLSERQLDHDRRAGLRAVCASIDDLRPLEDASFDIVLQPVSACYVPDVERVYREVARVLRPGGLYVVQHKAPAALQASGTGAIVEPCAEGRLLPPADGPYREKGTLEFLHTLDALLGGLCRAGFAIEDLIEPPRGDALAPPGSAGQRAWLLPPYLKIKARRQKSGLRR